MLQLRHEFKGQWHQKTFQKISLPESLTGKKISAYISPVQ
jgi:hypothetical protein